MTSAEFIRFVADTPSPQGRAGRDNITIRGIDANLNQLDKLIQTARGLLRDEAKQNRGDAPKDGE